MAERSGRSHEGTGTYPSTRVSLLTARENNPARIRAAAMSSERGQTKFNNGRAGYSRSRRLRIRSADAETNE